MSDQQAKLSEREMKTYRVQGFTCANCAGKFEKNVKKLSRVQDAKVNFGASKLSISGDATIEELEKAGAFENLKVTPEKPARHVSQEVWYTALFDFVPCFRLSLLLCKWRRKSSYNPIIFSINVSRRIVAF